MRHILVTGGAGFIGSNFIRYMLEHSSCEIINFDALTYAGNLKSLKDAERNSRYTFVKGDIRSKEQVSETLRKFGVDIVVNFAAETHVDRSILSPDAFVSTNVLGTQNLLECCRVYWSLSPEDKHCRDYKPDVRFLQISTDEVYGSLGNDGKFHEDSPIAPNSPYAASKASADLFVRAYWETFGFPAVITRCSNNFGPYQFPEKLIPLIIYNGLHDIKIPIYGDGQQVRNWLYVEDHCSALCSVLKSGKSGEVYNIGGDTEESNLQVVRTILRLTGRSENLIQFVADRPGHDRRYAMDYTKLHQHTGWKPHCSFEEGLERTVQWYLANETWLNDTADRDFQTYCKTMYT
ncbi:MAG: dTDP-glucose 4,6-dehydratase [Oscillibacter sp.]|nr:dTDP-glucose 4,6-dehydratase [Oscillibacter sp.]MCI9376906.1 dTDP-glucose 4,6-dehydratase [Oscillibacter sp.]